MLCFILPPSHTMVCSNSSSVGLITHLDRVHLPCRRAWRSGQSSQSAYTQICAIAAILSRARRLALETDPAAMAPTICNLLPRLAQKMSSFWPRRRQHLKAGAAAMGQFVHSAAIDSDIGHPSDPPYVTRATICGQPVQRAQFLPEFGEQGLRNARPQIGSAGRQEIIHGPKDWLHFNKRGYEVLANAIACGVADLKIWPASSCTRSVPSRSP